MKCANCDNDKIMYQLNGKLYCELCGVLITRWTIESMKRRANSAQRKDDDNK